MTDVSMSQIQSEVWHFLLERFADVENAIRRETIMSRFNLTRHSRLSDRDFRDIVAQLVTVFKKPICTSPSK